MDCERCRDLMAVGTFVTSGHWCHDLKILPEFYEAVRSGVKAFEIRQNDRDFRVGDLLHLKEWNGTRHTGRTLWMAITYMTDFSQAPGWVVLGLGTMVWMRRKP